MSFHVIIPAGGAGSRLWPLSRKNAPKFLADLTGQGRSLLVQTVDRLAPLADTTTIVCGSSHEAPVRKQVPTAHLLIEPSPRGTMSAIGLAAALARREDDEAVIGSFAADHLVTDEAAFGMAVKRAIEAAKEGYVVTIGIEPDSPSPAYGYIHSGKELHEGTYAVKSFVEKPDEVTAASYLAAGSYFWNAGMFVAKASVLLEALARFSPEISAPLETLALAWPRKEAGGEEAYARAGMNSVELTGMWEAIPEAVIDRAIAEPLAAKGGVAVVPAQMGWSDVGDYESLAGVIDPPARAAQVSPGGELQPTLRIDSPNSLIYTYSKPVVVVGIEGAVVVETDDVILLTCQEAAQSVKSAVETLDQVGLGRLR